MALLSTPSLEASNSLEAFQSLGQELVTQAKNLSRAGVRSFVLSGAWDLDPISAAQKHASYGILLSALRQVCSERLYFMSPHAEGASLARVSFCEGFIHQCPLEFFHAGHKNSQGALAPVEGLDLSYFVSSYDLMRFLKEPAWTWRENAKRWARTCEGRTLFIEAPSDWSSEAFRERWLVWIELLNECGLSLSILESEENEFWEEDNTLWASFQEIIMSEDWSSLSAHQIREKSRSFQNQIEGA